MSKNDAGVRAVARLGRVFEKRLADEGMSLPQFRVMAFLSEGEWAASKVAEWLAVSRPSLTSLVDGLVEQGWVERKEHPTDRRSVLHHLTAPGRARLDEATDVLTGFDLPFGFLTCRRGIVPFYERCGWRATTSRSTMIDGDQRPGPDPAVVMVLPVTAEWPSWPDGHVVDRNGQKV